MPVGLPKVPYRPSGRDEEDEEYSWPVLYDRLQRRRILFLANTLTHTLSNQLNSAMVYLNNDDSSKGQYMYINSPGGNILWGLSVHDTMQNVDATVCTTCVGVSISVASLVLSAGTPGSRFALPHARMMIHQPDSKDDDLGGALGYEINQLEAAKKALIRSYVARTKQDAIQIEYDLDRDSFMYIDEAIFYGLIDGLAEGPPSYT